MECIERICPFSEYTKMHEYEEGPSVEGMHAEVDYSTSTISVILWCLHFDLVHFGEKNVCL